MSKNRNRQRLRRNQRQVRRLRWGAQHATPMPSTKLLNVVSWNCNGILRNDTPGLIAEVMIKHDIDVFLVSETHIRSGAVEDLSALDQFEMYHKSRGGVDKRFADSSKKGFKPHATCAGCSNVPVLG